MAKGKGFSIGGGGGPDIFSALLGVAALMLLAAIFMVARGNLEQTSGSPGGSSVVGLVQVR